MGFDPDSLTYDSRGLIPCIAQDEATGQVLMLAWMNRDSLVRTLDTGLVTYWSRSRKELWVKGATSGHFQHLVSLGADCDRDCLLAIVRQEGVACHTGAFSCFFNDLRRDPDASPEVT